MNNFSKIENRNYLIFSAIFILISFFIMQEFIFGIIGGALTALSVWPIFEFICSKKYKFLKTDVSDNAFIFAFTFGLIFIIPLLYSIFEMYHIYSIGATYITENTDNGILKIPDFVQILPYKEKIISLWEHNIANSSSFTDIINKFSKETLFSFSSYLLSGLLNKIVTILVMVISFYFMLKNGSQIRDNYKETLNYWIGKKAIHQIDNGIEALRGTINGVILIGIVEGVLLSIPLVASEFPSGFVIGLAAGILGVIPLLMPILMAPCLAYLYLSGDTTWAIIGMVDLTLVWFICENIIKPQVIGQKVKVNTFIILASMIGGMQLLGFLGLFVGPALVSMAIGMLSDMLTIHKEEN